MHRTKLGGCVLTTNHVSHCLVQTTHEISDHMVCLFVCLFVGWLLGWFVVCWFIHSFAFM